MQERIIATVDLDALAHNYCILRKLAGDANLMAVVKADAYGHGAVPVARKLEMLGADWLAVATADEALELRGAEIRLPILVLGYTPPERASMLAGCGVTLTVAGPEHAAVLSETAVQGGFQIRAHFKLDTGMSRLGFSDINELAASLKLPGLTAEGLYTHLAMSDEPSDAFTRIQTERFAAALEQLNGHVYIHCANSGGVIYYQGREMGNLVRAGLALYGYEPAGTRITGLRPVMSLRSSVAMVRVVKAGETVSYGRRWTAQRDTRVAVLQCGYADGYHRSLSGRGEVLLCGERCPILGTVCMDMMMVDVSRIPDVKTGDSALLFGEAEDGGIPLGELAQKAGTIPYELLCAVSSRVPRKYTGNSVMLAIDS